MNKSGFSLVELLCVIAVIALVGTIATVGVMKISDTSDSEKLRAKKELLLESAILYGEDKKSLINQKCTVNNEDSKCLKIKVQDLLDNKYYSAYETCKDSKEKNCIYDDTTKTKMNDYQIIIYLKSSSVLAKFEQDIDVKISL